MYVMVKKEFYVTQEQDSKLQYEKDKSGLSKSEIVRRALDKYFNNENKGDGIK